MAAFIKLGYRDSKVTLIFLSYFKILVPTGGLVPPIGDKISSMWSQYCMFYGVLKYDKNQGYRTGLVTVIDKAPTEHRQSNAMCTVHIMLCLLYIT